jgi:t-SNARE complex subunit (syntaxin)
VLFVEQDELIDAIGENVTRSLAYERSGKRELEKAKNYEKSASRKTCYIVVCGCVTVAVVLAVVVGATLPK